MKIQMETSEPVCKVDYKDKSFLFYTLDNCCISTTIKRNDIWEPHLHSIFEKYVNENSIVIECGCHIGTHTIKLASLAKKVYGFEPMPQTYEVLKKNIQINQIANVDIFQKGVADKEGWTQFSWIPENNPGGSGLDNNPMGKPTWIEATNKKVDVELTAIDSLRLNKLDFMKIDVEGYEPLVIKGAMKTITKYKPVICMEVWKNHFGGIDIEYTKHLFKDLLDIGYNVYGIGGPDFLFIPLHF